MPIRQTIGVLLLLLLAAVGMAWGQDTSGQDSASQQTTPPPAHLGRKARPSLSTTILRSLDWISRRWSRIFSREACC